MLSDSQRAAGAGFYRFLTKPVSVDELTTALEERLVPADSEVAQILRRR